MRYINDEEGVSERTVQRLVLLRSAVMGEAEISRSKSGSW